MAAMYSRPHTVQVNKWLTHLITFPKQISGKIYVKFVDILKQIEFRMLKWRNCVVHFGTSHKGANLMFWLDCSCLLSPLTKPKSLLAKQCALQIIIIIIKIYYNTQNQVML